MDLPRNTKITIVASGVMSVSGGLLQMLMIFYYIELGYGRIYGSIISVSLIFSMVFTIVSGAIADRGFIRAMGLIGTILSPVSTMIFYFANSISLLLAGAILSSVGFSIRGTAYSLIIANETHGNKRTKAYSTLFMIQLGASIIGSALFGLSDVMAMWGFSRIESYRALLGIAMLNSLIALPIYLLVHPSSKKEHSSANIFQKDSSYISPKRALFGFTLQAFIIGFGASLFIPYINLYMKIRYGFSDSLLAVIGMLSNLSMMGGYAISPTLGEKIGPIKTVVLTQTGSVLLLISFPFMNAIILVIAVIIRWALMNMAAPVSSSLIMELIDVRQRGRARGIRNVGMSAGRMLGLPIGNNLIYTLPELAPVACGIVYAFAVLVIAFTFKGKKISMSGIPIMQNLQSRPGTFPKTPK